MPDRRRKLLERLEQSPKAVSSDSLHKVLVAFGYERKRQKGSHRTYGKPGAYPLTVPYKRPHVKRAYVELVIARLRQELAEEGKGEKDQRGGRIDGRFRSNRVLSRGPRARLAALDH